uniref:Putative Lon protease n=1 Tax=Anthurium amnicola TaxID=1678845 RepID=A0A1D1YNV8_9ARAE
MNQKFIFAFILLATFSMVNATPHQFRKRGSLFNACSTTQATQANTLSFNSFNVTINPDPLVAGAVESFNVFGTLNSDTSSSTQLVILFTDSYQNLLAPPYIQQVNTPIKSGTQFSINAQQVPAPAILPQDSLTYSISVILGYPTSDMRQPLSIYGCASSGFQSDIYSVLGNSYPVAGNPF